MITDTPHNRELKINFQSAFRNLAKRILGLEATIAELHRIKYVQMKKEITQLQLENKQLKTKVELLMFDYHHRQDDLK